MSWVSGLVTAALAFYTSNEALGLFLFLLVEEAGVPLWFLPGDTLVMAAGARPGNTTGTVLLILLAAAGGAFCGSTALYAIVRRGGRPLLDRYGHVLHLNQKRIGTMEGWFHRYGALAIVVGRLIPGLRSPTTVMSGLFEVPYWIFASATAVAAVLWALMYFFAGALLASQWQSLVTIVTTDADDVFGLAVLIILLVIGAGAIVRRRRAAHAAQ
ncbi:MAG: DedA family protein [Chloroflexota bacterium]|nr:DedA family protein [Chloroflexota bacterium]